MTAGDRTSISDPDLPYSARLHRSFMAFSRWFAGPLLRAGVWPLMNNPLTGYVFLLRTRGRKSGLLRDAPLDYAILDGRVYCIAGFGGHTQWLRNVRADPRVEAVLPGGAISGRAEEVDDADEWVRGFRAVLCAGGLAGYLLGFDPRSASDDTIRRRAAGIPLVRITPTGVAPGPFDPGGRGWIPVHLVAGWTAWRRWGCRAGRSGWSRDTGVRRPGRRRAAPGRAVLPAQAMPPGGVRSSRRHLAWDGPASNGGFRACPAGGTRYRGT